MNKGRWTVNFALLPLAWLAVAAPVDVRRDAVVRAVEKVMPAVVNISTETVVEVRDPFEQMLREFWGPYYRQRSPDVEYSLGSGVIIDEEGYLLTNDHVVRRASRVKVKLADGREFEAQPLAGTERTDLALLRIKVPKGTRFTPAHFAPDDDLLLGETVIALGNPFGLGGSVSRGILSSKARRAPREGERLDIANWLQTDASINPGNSGGPADQPARGVDWHQCGSTPKGTRHRLCNSHQAGQRGVVGFLHGGTHPRAVDGRARAPGRRKAESKQRGSGWAGSQRRASRGR